MTPYRDHRPRRTPVDFERLRRIGRELLEAIGEDPDRAGLRDTPRRWAGWWREFAGHDPGTLDTAFAERQCGSLVVVGGMRVWSVCEHHLIPFWCDVAVGYVPRGKVLGLSKFARVARKHAHRLQVQERLAGGVADEVAALAGSPDVAVLVAGEHLCLTMRGARTPAVMRCLAARGRFEGDAAARAEFLALAAGVRP